MMKKILLLMVTSFIAMSSSHAGWADLMGQMAQTQASGMASGVGALAQAQQGAMGAMAAGMQAQQGLMAQGVGALTTGMAAKDGAMQQGMAAMQQGMQMRDGVMSQGMAAAGQLNQSVNGVAIARQEAFVTQKEASAAANATFFEFLETAMSEIGDETLAFFEDGEEVETESAVLVKRCREFKEKSDLFVANQNALFAVLDEHIGLPPGYQEPPIGPSVASQPLIKILNDSSGMFEGLKEQFVGDEDSGGYDKMMAIAEKALMMAAEEEEDSSGGGFWAMARAQVKKAAQNNLRIMPTAEYAGMRAQVKQAQHNLLSVCSKVLYEATYPIVAKRYTKALSGFAGFVDAAFAENYTEVNDEDDEWGEDEGAELTVPRNAKKRHSAYVLRDASLRGASMDLWVLTDAVFGSPCQPLVALSKIEPEGYDYQAEYQAQKDVAFKANGSLPAPVMPIDAEVRNTFVAQRDILRVAEQKMRHICSSKFIVDAEAAPVEADDIAVEVDGGDEDNEFADIADDVSSDVDTTTSLADDSGDDDSEFEYDEVESDESVEEDESGYEADDEGGDDGWGDEWNDEW